MGAQTSVQREEKSQQEEASAEEGSAAANDIQEGDSLADSKLLQKNGQISSIPSLNGHSEDNTLEEVSGQTDSVSVSQKEEAPETMDAVPGEAALQVNGEKDEKEPPEADDITAVEEKPAEEKPAEANEVGFKKIFRFVGFKFTLKKNEKKDPVQLLTVKDKEGEEEEAGGSEAAKEEAAAPVEEEVKAEDQAPEAEVPATEAPATETTAEDAATDTDAPATDAAAEPTDGEAAAAEEVTKEEEGATEKEPEEQAASPASPPQEVPQSAFKKFFTQGIFSNLRKKTSFKKPKEEEPKEAPVEDKIKEGEESAEVEPVAAEEGDKAEVVEGEVKEEEPATTPEDTKPEASPDTEAEAVEEVSAEVQAEDEVKPEVAVETSAPVAGDAAEDVTPIEDKAEEKAEEAADEGDKAPTEVAAEAELLSSQEKAKAQGSPLKKLFAGAGLKKLSAKKQKAKKDTEAKLTESGEQTADQLLSSTEGVEGQKPSSGPSSPEDSGEHVVATEASSQAEVGQDAEAEAATSDGEKKKDGILPWSSFKKLVTPKKRVKRASESEDEATGEKPKSATLSSTESAVFVDKPSSEEETKPTAEEEQKTENTEKLEGSTEEPKKKMDTSVSWEALMCMGGKSKRTRRTSDSDDDETKIEEETQLAGEEDAKTFESPLLSSQEAEREIAASSPEPGTNSAGEGELVSTWESLKRFVSQKSKKKGDEKSEDGGHTEVLSDSEIPKEESSFSLRKLIPGRKKKKSDKQLSSDVGSGEDDSDTPAVVPLSEYDNEQQAAAEETVETPAPVQVTTEDRAPSWISALVVTEEVHEQLSDIPEEGDTAATPKSADTTIAEEIVDLTTESAVVAQEEVPVMAAAEPTTIAEETVDLSTEVAVAQEEVIAVSAADVIATAEESVEMTTELVVVQEEVPAVSTVEVTTIAEEILDPTTEAVVAQEEVPVTSAAEVAAELLPVTQETTVPESEPERETVDVVLEEVVEVNEVSTESSIPVEDLPEEEADAGMEPPAPVEAIAPCEMNVVLGAYVKEAATTVCTGLDTKDIDHIVIEKSVVTTEVCVDAVTDAEVAELPLVRDAHVKEEAIAFSTGQDATDIDMDEIENLPTSTVEDIAVVTNILSAEVPVEEKPEKIEEAVTAEAEEVLKAQVEQVETTQLEPPTEKMVNEEPPKPETASDGKEPEIIQEATVSSIQNEAEIVQPPVVSENTPKVEMMDPIEPTNEAVVCSEILQTTAPAVLETKCEELDTAEETAVVELKAPACEVTQVESREIAAVMPETPLADEMAEATVSVVPPTEERAIAKEIVCLIAPLPVDVEQAQIQQEVNVLENVPVSEPAPDQIQVQVMEVPIEVATIAGEAEIRVPDVSEVSCATVEATEKVQEEPEAELADEIEEQGMAIAQVVIQNAVDVVESTPEPEEPAPVGDEEQAISTTEEEVPEECPVILESPVLQLHDATPAPETPAPETAAPETSAPETPAPETLTPEIATPETSVEADTTSKQLHEAIEITETVSVECLQQEAPKQPEEPVKTMAPEVPAPETLASETPAPETAAPETPVPETPAPETAAPETPAPEILASETPAPETPVSEISVPETAASDTPAPEILTSETPASETPAPETPAPETPAPETPAPETAAPETSAPVEVTIEADQTPKQIHEAIEITEMVSVEVLEPEAPKEPEESVKQDVEEEIAEVDLKQTEEVVICKETVEVVEEEVKEVPESQMNGKSEETQEEDSKVEAPQVVSPAAVEDGEAQQAELKEVPVAAAVIAEIPVLEAVEKACQTMEKTEVAAAPVVHQAAQIIEEQAVELIGEQELEEIVMEAAVEFNGTGVANDNATANDAPAPAVAVETNMKEDKEPTPEEAEKSASTDAPVPASQEAASQTEPPAAVVTEKAVKCAEVMAQVIEVIEEAVKEIEPVSAELTAAS